MMFGDRVRQLRQEKSVGLKTLAKRCGVNVAYLSRVEGGKVPPSQGLIEKLAQVLSHDSDELSILAQKLPDTWLSSLATDPEAAVRGLRRSLEQVGFDEDNGLISEPVSLYIPREVERFSRYGARLLELLRLLHHTEQYEDAYASWATHFRHLEDSTRLRFDLYVVLTRLFFGLLAARSERIASWILPQLDPEFWRWFSPDNLSVGESVQWSEDLLQDTYAALNPLEDIRAFGKVFTPPTIAAYVIKRLGFPGPAKKNDCLLDPAAGCGVFFMKALDRLALRNSKHLSH
ncbi:MAG: helix-turn-helix transcriptional regulator, partial [Deltaproteobacteria bacterium]|nr:helix-turn-helix transcriptional regulator [Deltaproteobacteria bacterium]